jgi:hypothetical protein
VGAGRVRTQGHPTLLAPECLATLLRASWRMRKRTASPAGESLGSPETSSDDLMPFCSPKSVTKPRTVSMKPRRSRSIGRRAKIERRTSLICSRRVSFAVSSSARTRAGSVASRRLARSSLRAVKARLWAMPSWISRAMRLRSSRMASSSEWR